ncbi:hypothetical protein NP493_1452g00031 [Ridgeia piscesae]|uniref:Thymidine phosphorylase n=1 Tax=Ridgeia piscesae TaxID=27915 RepID=A0AAD9NDW9_RIDPI|nr:hypothetical protein NP493_1452g00031 [Ridgeia piscesae]
MAKSSAPALSIPELIQKKRDGERLSTETIRTFVSGVVNGDMQDCQIGAMLMAIFQRGLDKTETVTLTDLMTQSGDVLSWPDEWRHLVVDKHSTGGVGDKISLPLVAALAACGLKVPMISGRGLGLTGGTLDKLESIPGYKVEQDKSDIIRMVTDIGCCIVGQTSRLVPADKKLYSIRDVTSTVDCIPLIGASIISKKAAESLSSLVLDVKFGRGALYKTPEGARELASELVSLGEGVGIRTTALLTCMDNVLGRTVGNALEVVESFDCLRGAGPSTLTELVTKLGGHLMVNAKQAANVEEGQKRIANSLENGEAMKKFAAMMKAQGVSPDTVAKLTKSHADTIAALPRAKFTRHLECMKPGYVTAIDAIVCADVSARLGAGRMKASDVVDPAVGLELYVDVGSSVKKGDRWMTIHYNNDPLSEDFVSRLQQALSVDAKEPKCTSLINCVITGKDVKQQNAV